MCSEIDVVAKEIASYFNSSFEDEKNPNIQRWGFVIQSGLPEICTRSVVFSDEVLVSPWKNFGYERYTAKNNSTRYKLKKGCNTPCWWKDYNDIKHKRTSFGESGGANYTKANLKNMILCYAALFILESAFSEHLVQQGQNDYCMFESKLFGYSSTKKCAVILP